MQAVRHKPLTQFFKPKTKEAEPKLDDGLIKALKLGIDPVEEEIMKYDKPMLQRIIEALDKAMERVKQLEEEDKKRLGNRWFLTRACC